MNLKEFTSRHYDTLRESGSLGIAILVHVVLFIMFFFVTFTTSATGKAVIKAMITKISKPEVEPPKPEVRAQTPVPVNREPIAPRPREMRKIDSRIVVKQNVKTEFKVKPMLLAEIKKTEFKNVMDVGKSVRNAFNIGYGTKFETSGSGGGIKARIEQIVVIQYDGGDWDCEFTRTGKMVTAVTMAGSIPNLIYEIKRRTDIVVVNPTAAVVRADSPEIMNSPFVYFTGHENFTLTEPEVENLRTYLLQGYAIVANSALPGRRSRFDVGFRREMKRVIPDHELQPIGKEHPLFKSFASFERVPSGMNKFQEPIEVINIDNRDVVIYNLNDYGDLMLARLDETGKAFKFGQRKDGGGYWEGPRMHNAKRYGGVNDVPTVINAYNFTINVLAYLLTR